MERHRFGNEVRALLRVDLRGAFFRLKENVFRQSTSVNSKLRRQYLRYQQAENIYRISHKKLLELVSDAGAIYRIDGTVPIRRDIFDDYLERFHESATGKDKGKMTDER